MPSVLDPAAHSLLSSATGLWTPAAVHLSGQEHTRALCNARLSVFIRMKRRIGWRTWNVDSSMSATLLPGSIAPESSHLRGVGKEPRKIPDEPGKYLICVPYAL